MPAPALLTPEMSLNVLSLPLPAHEPAGGGGASG